MTPREVMQQALDAIGSAYREHFVHTHGSTRNELQGAANAIRAELSKPAAEVPPGCVRQYERDQAEIAALRAALQTARCKESNDTWIWAGDGHDHLESMSHGMTVVIRASELRRLIAEGSKPAAVPDGWVIVPIEPTPAMLWEGFPLCSDENARSDYAALLTAAPQPPAPAVSPVDVEAVREVVKEMSGFFFRQSRGEGYKELATLLARACGSWKVKLARAIGEKPND